MLIPVLVRPRLARLLLVPLLCAATVSAQQSSPPAQTHDAKIYLDVVVAPKSGPAVSGLQQQDFTLFDNKVPQTITSFKPRNRSDAPLEVLLVLDAVNASYQTVAFERGEIDRFLRADAGHLAHPTALAVFTDTGIEIQPSFSDDGNALSASLDQYIVGLRTIRRSAAFYGAVERFQLSLAALHQLAARETTRPGRKVIIWISPGWPLLSGPEVLLDTKQQQEFFDDIVSLSTMLLRARTTLYSVDPLGSSDFGTRTFYYLDFVKGIREPRQVDIGDLALQVLAIQSGGLALNMNNDVTSLLQRCIADTGSYYEISFDPPSSAKPDEYHQLEIKLNNPALTARTRQGYYAQPDLKQPRKVPVIETPVASR